MSRIDVLSINFTRNVMTGQTGQYMLQRNQTSCATKRRYVVMALRPHCVLIDEHISTS